MGTKVQLKHAWGKRDLYVNGLFIKKDDIKTQAELFHKIVDAIGKCDKTSSTFLREELFEIISRFSVALDQEIFDDSKTYFWISELELN